MKPIVEDAPLAHLSIRVRAWIAYRLATKANVEAHVYRRDAIPIRFTVRVATGLLDLLDDDGKLYAFEALPKPRFGPRFRHRGRWYLVCKKEDWEQLRNHALELAAASPEQRPSIAGRHVTELIRGRAIANKSHDEAN